MEQFAKGRVALVTGAARGIGYACARNLARQGVKVALVDINGDRIKEAAAKLAAETGEQALGIQADISSESDVARMAAEANTAFGKVDIFLNSAAILADNLFLESTPADWDRMFKVSDIQEDWHQKAIDKWGSVLGPIMSAPKPI